MKHQYKLNNNRLTFNVVRAANVHRLPLFKNKKGKVVHSKPDGSDWLLSQWSNATLGELGEAANLIKKIERGDYTLDEKREELAKEIADVAVYLDLLAYRCEIDLGDAIIQKFNEVSDRVGVPIKISTSGDYIHNSISVLYEEYDFNEE